MQLGSGASEPSLLQQGEGEPPHAEQGFLSAAAFMSALEAAPPSMQPRCDPVAARPLWPPAHGLAALSPGLTLTLTRTRTLTLT